MSSIPDYEIYELLRSERRTRTVGRIAFGVVAAFAGLLLIGVVAAGTLVLTDDGSSVHGVFDGE